MGAGWDSFKAKNPNMGKVLGGIGTAAAWAGRNTAEKVPLIDNRWKRRAKARLDAEEEKEKARLAEQSSAPMPRGATSAQIPDAFSKSVNQAISIIVSNKSRPASALEAPHVLYQIVTSDDFRHSVESTVARVVDQRSGNASLVTTKSPLEDDSTYEYGMRPIREGLVKKLSGSVGTIEFSNEERDVILTILCSNPQYFEVLMGVVESTAQKEAKGNEGLFVASFLHHITTNYTITGTKPQTPPARTLCPTALANEWVSSKSRDVVEATVEDFALAAYSVLATASDKTVGGLGVPGLHINSGVGTADADLARAAKGISEFRSNAVKNTQAIDGRINSLSRKVRPDGSNDQEVALSTLHTYQQISAEVSDLTNNQHKIASAVAAEEGKLGDLSAVQGDIDAAVVAQKGVLDEVVKFQDATTKHRMASVKYDSALRSGSNTDRLQQEMQTAESEVDTARSALAGANRQLNEATAGFAGTDVETYVKLKLNQTQIEHQIDLYRRSLSSVEAKLDALAPDVSSTSGIVPGLVSLAKERSKLYQTLSTSVETIVTYYGVSHNQLPAQFRAALLAKKEVGENRETPGAVDSSGNHFFTAVPSALGAVENTTVTALTSRVDKLVSQVESLRSYREAVVGIEYKKKEKAAVAAAINDAKKKDLTIEANAKEVADLEGKSRTLDLDLSSLEGSNKASGLQSDFDAFNAEITSVRAAVTRASLPVETKDPINEILDALNDPRTTKETLGAKLDRRYKTVKEVHAYPMKRAAAVAIENVVKSRTSGPVAPGQYIAMASAWSVVAPGKDVGVEGKGKLQVITEKVDRTLFSTYNARRAAAWLYEHLGFKRTWSLLRYETFEYNIAVDERGVPLTDASKANKGWAYKYLRQSKFAKNWPKLSAALYYGLYPITGISFEPASRRIFSGLRRTAIYAAIAGSVAVWAMETGSVQPTQQTPAAQYTASANFAKPREGDTLNSLYSHYFYSRHDRQNGGYRFIPFNLSFPYARVIGGTITDGIPGAFSSGFTRRFPFVHPIDATAAFARPYAQALDQEGSLFTWLNPVNPASEVRGWDGSPMRSGNIVSVYDDSPHIPERLAGRGPSFFGQNYRVLDNNNQAWLIANPSVARFFQERASLRRFVDGTMSVVEPSPNVCATRQGVGGLHCNLLVMQLNPITDGLRLNAYQSDAFVARIRADISRDQPANVREYLENKKLEYAQAGFLVPINQWRVMHRFGLTDQNAVAFIQRNGVHALALLDGLVNRAASDRYLPHGHVVGHVIMQDGRFGRTVGSTTRFDAEANRADEFVTSWMTACGNSTEALSAEALRAGFDQAVAGANYLVDVSAQHAEVVLQGNIAALGLQDPSAIDTYRTGPGVRELLDLFIQPNSAYVIKTGKADAFVIAVAMHIQAGGVAADFDPFSTTQGSRVAEILAQGEEGFFVPRRTEISSASGSSVSVTTNNTFADKINDAFGVVSPGHDNPSAIILEESVIQTAIRNGGDMGQANGHPRLDPAAQEQLTAALRGATTDDARHQALARYVIQRIETLAAEVAAGVPPDLTGAARDNAQRRLSSTQTKLAEAGITNVRMENGRVVYDFNTATNWNAIQGFIIQQCFGGTPPISRTRR